MELNLNYKILNFEIEGCIDEDNLNNWSFLEKHHLNNDDIFEIYDELNEIIIIINLIKKESEIYNFTANCIDCNHNEPKTILFYLVWDKINNYYHTKSIDKKEKILPDYINKMLLRGLFGITPEFNQINLI